MNDQRTVMGLALRRYRADLHIHTALSPCASDEMTPPAIVATALEAGLDMIAISDHNTAGNVDAVRQAAEAAGGDLVVLAGMEITSAEEVHVLALFPDTVRAEDVATRLRALLPVADAGYYSFFGDQPLQDAEGRTTGVESAALAAATPLDLNETVDLIHEAGGVAIAAHIDRKAFSVFSQLGLFPHDAGLDAAEVSRHIAPGSPRLSDFAAIGLPLTGSSDAHFLEEIGAAATELHLAEPTFAEVALALVGAEHRGVTRA